MAKKAKRLAAVLLNEGWRPGRDIRATRTFEHVSEMCGVDVYGHAVRGAEAEIHLGDDADGYGIRDLFESLTFDRFGDPVGPTFTRDYLDPRQQMPLFEAGGAMAAVDYSAFMGVTGQLMVTHVLEPFTQEQYVASRLVPTYPSPLEQERWIGIASPKDPGDDITLLQEQEPLRYIGFGEQYVETPMTRKRALGIGLTKEMLFFDRTGKVIDQAKGVGNVLALQKEKELLGVMIGGTTNPVYFKEKRQWDSAPITLDLFQREGASSGSYQLAYAHSSRPYPFYNDIPDNPLTDYTSVKTADVAFGKIVDPNTGEPIVVGKPFILATHGRRIDLMRIVEAEMIWNITAGGLNTTGGINTVGKNVLKQIGLTADALVTSRQLRAQLMAQFSTLSSDEADSVWFYGDPTEAFSWVENWPITVVQAPVNSEAEFSQDILLRWKASMRGRGAIRNPRVWQRHNFYQSGSGVDAS